MVEDDNACRRKLKDALEKEGHQVPLEAVNCEQAFRLINGNKLREKGVTVAVVDGYLPAHPIPLRNFSPAHPLPPKSEGKKLA